MGTTTKGSVPTHNTKMPLPKQVKDTVHNKPSGTIGKLKGLTGTNYNFGNTNQAKKKG